MHDTYRQALQFYHGFMTPAIMVYLGAPNARQYAPGPTSPAFLSSRHLKNRVHLRFPTPQRTAHS